MWLNVQTNLIFIMVENNKGWNNFLADSQDEKQNLLKEW